MRIRKSALSSLLVAALALTAQGHEFWIQPTDFVASPGSVLAAELRIGHAGHSETYARNPEHLIEFFVQGPAGRTEMVGRPGQDPAGWARLDAPGVHTLGYRSNPNQLRMEAAKFESYLLEEGLDDVVRQRREAGETGLPAIESYSRFAKALVRTPGSPTTGFDRVLGFELELVPVNDPYVLADAAVQGGGLAPLTVQVLQLGRPLAGVRVEAQCLSQPELEPLKVRTDAEGRARLALPRSGQWLFATIHMARAQPQDDLPRGHEGDSGADWVSAWASLALEVPARAADPVTEAPKGASAGGGAVLR